MSDDKAKKRQLNNRLLDFSYRQTKLFSLIVGVLCFLSAVIPVLEVSLASDGVQACVGQCARVVLAEASGWSYALAVLTGLVNALAIVSVAIGIYSIAEARAGSEENAETATKIETIHSSLKGMFPQLGSLQTGIDRSADRLDEVSEEVAEIHSNLQTMLLQMQKLQAGINQTTKELNKVCYALEIDYDEAEEESDDFDTGEVDENDR